MTEIDFDGWEKQCNHLLDVLLKWLIFSVISVVGMTAMILVLLVNKEWRFSISPINWPSGILLVFTAMIVVSIVFLMYYIAKREDLLDNKSEFVRESP